MRPNGTRELARIDAELYASRMALMWRPDKCSMEVNNEWNALHDTVTALEAERRSVEMNAPVADAPALLVHRNID